MSAIAYSVTDSVTMLRRVFVHMLRDPRTTILATLGTPIVLLVLMYNLFGGVIQLSGTANASYINYLTPGMIVITAIYGTGLAALRVNSDMTQGIIARFRSMSIARGSVLTGHVVGSSIGTLISIAAVLGLAFLMGFRSPATAIEALTAVGLIVLYVVATMWFAIAVGVASKSPAAANGTLYLFYLLPFFSSAFTPTTTMTPIVAWIADNQPFTPIIETLRALLTGAPTGDRALVAFAWCVGLGLVGYVWSRVAYNRNANQ
jgi:ABC-2 type transport system permease protein